MLEDLLVFDIETVPDVLSCYGLFGLDVSEFSVAELRQKLVDYHLEITGGNNGFLRQPFHSVVVISFLRAKIIRDGAFERYVLHEIRSGGAENSSEAELLNGFVSYFSSLKPRIVTFNGRTFDIPVIKYRCMVHGIQAECLYRSGDKWNNYMNRYSHDWHCDLLDFLSDYGASARVKINEVCAVLGYPGKLSCDGGDVMKLYDDGKIGLIRDYCETDVLNTYLVYLRTMYHNGRLKVDAYNEAVDDMVECLKGSGKKHFMDFLQEWLKSSRGILHIEERRVSAR